MCLKRIEKKKKNFACYTLLSLKVALNGTALVFDNTLSKVMFLFLKVMS